MEPPINSRVARTLEEIKHSADLWRSWQWHPNSDIDAYLYSLRSIPGILNPYVVSVSRGEQPEALLVGRCERSRIAVRVGYRNLANPEFRVLRFIHGGLLGRPSPEASQVAVQQILTSLDSGEADAAH